MTAYWEHIALAISICIFGVVMVYAGWRYREHVEWKTRKGDASDRTQPSQKQTQAEAARDQVWASLRDKYADLERVIQEGPSQDGDVALVTAAVMATLGEIRYRAALAKLEP